MPDLETPIYVEKEVYNPRRSPTNKGLVNGHNRPPYLILSPTYTEALALPLMTTKTTNGCLDTLPRTFLHLEKEEWCICGSVAIDNRVIVDTILSKPGTLNLLITGKEVNVLKAKNELLRVLYLERICEVKIPNFTLHWTKTTLKEFENALRIKLELLKSDDDSLEMVKIKGPKPCVQFARRALTHNIASTDSPDLEFIRHPLDRKFHKLVCFSIMQKDSRTNLTSWYEDKSEDIWIGVPPSMLALDEIFLMAQFSTIEEAIVLIEDTVHDLREHCQELSVEIPQEQHKALIDSDGLGTDDIFQSTGVVVYIPRSNFDSGCNSVQLYGPREKLSSALSLVLKKANQIATTRLPIPGWLHRFMIGPMGNALNKLVVDRTQMHLGFDGVYSQVRLEGPSIQLEETANKIKSIKEQLELRFAQTDLDFHVDYFPDVTLQLDRLREKTGCSFLIKFSNQGVLLRIEGIPASVVKAKQSILEIVKAKNSNAQLQSVIDNLHTSSNDIIQISTSNSKKLIHLDIEVTQKLHSHLVGPHGSGLDQLERDIGSEVQLIFPDSENSALGCNTVRLHGTKEAIVKAQQILSDRVQELASSLHVEKLYVSSKMAHYIRGCHGTATRRICESVGARLNFPNEGEDWMTPNPQSQIHISGTSDAIATAREAIEEMINLKHGTNVTRYLKVSESHHKALATIYKTRVNDLCSRNNVHFDTRIRESAPMNKGGLSPVPEHAGRSLSDPATHEYKLRGERSAVDNVIVALNKLRPVEETLTVPSDLHGFLSGENSSEVRQFCGRYRVTLEPKLVNNRKSGCDKWVVLRGLAGDVAVARKEMPRLISRLIKIEENRSRSPQQTTPHQATIHVNPVLHRQLIGARGAGVSELRRRYSVSISLPLPGSGSDAVLISGRLDRVETAKKAILSIVANMSVKSSTTNIRPTHTPSRGRPFMTFSRHPQTNKRNEEVYGHRKKFPASMPDKSSTVTNTGDDNGFCVRDGPWNENSGQSLTTKTSWSQLVAGNLSS